MGRNTEDGPMPQHILVTGASRGYGDLARAPEIPVANFRQAQWFFNGRLKTT